MNAQTAQNLWPALIADVQTPGLLVQLLVLIVCLFVGWRISPLLVRHFSRVDASLSGSDVPVDSFHRVLAPLLAVILVALAVPALDHWQNADSLRIVLPLLLAFVLIRTVFFMLRKAFVKDGRIGRALRAVEQSFALIVWLGFALYASGLWPELIELLEQTTVPIGRHRESVLIILQALISVAITVMIALWASAVLEQRLMKFDAVHSSIRVVLARAGKALFLLIAVLISLSLVGIDLTVLSVFGGALGVGLGLGLQKLVSSYVSGVVILLERSLALGDVVAVDRFRGEVVQINARCTILRASDGSEAVIPNEMMVSSPVQNFSLSGSQVRLSSQFIVAYQVNIDEFAMDIQQSLSKLPRVLADPAVEVLIKRLAPEGVELEVAFWIADPEKGSVGLISEVNQRLLGLIQGLRVFAADPGEKESPVPAQTDKSLIHKPSSDVLSD